MMETKTFQNEIVLYKKTPLDEKRILNFTTVTGDLKSWVQLRKEAYAKNDIVQEHISSQFVIAENPDVATMVRAGIKPPPGTQAHLQTVIVTSVIEFHEKKKVIA